MNLRWSDFFKTFMEKNTVGSMENGKRWILRYADSPANVSSETLERIALRQFISGWTKPQEVSLSCETIGCPQSSQRTWTISYLLHKDSDHCPSEMRKTMIVDKPHPLDANQNP